jgi:hypothetical protein
MKKYCWDCLYFKTREYDNLKAIKPFFTAHVRLAMELKKASKERRPARYWRCSIGRAKTEVYVLERTARTKEACQAFESMG